MNQPLNKQMLFDEISGKPFRILLIEDNQGDVVIFKELLKSSGVPFSVTNVSSLEEALVFCRRYEYDVILLDLGLPDSSGIETLRKIQLSHVEPPVVVMTGLDDEDTALDALREGAQDYLVKNKLTSENILRSIKYGIERKKLQVLQEKNARQISIISSTSSELNECEDISLIYTIICKNINKLLDTARVLAVEYVNHENFRLSNIEWLLPWAEKIGQLTNLEVNEEIFRLREPDKKLLDFFQEGKLHEISGGLNELLLGDKDNIYCKELEQIMRIGIVYTIGFIKSRIIYGGLIILSDSRIDNDDRKIIETISSDAALSINRRLIYSNLRISESNVRKLNEELEQKVKDRTEELESANKLLTIELKERILAQEALKKSETTLIELNATKDKFFNIVAHDLKNPFTSLLGSTELLYENINRMDKDSIKKLAQILNDSAKSGYAILLNLLDWSRSQAGLITYNPQWINLKDIIEDNISDLNLYTANKEIKLISGVKEDFYIFADENMINTILRNLLSNAVKFTYRFGEINVNAVITASETIISVSDTGIGLSLENINKLFRIDTKYTRPGTDLEQGTGLGLKLCKEFVEQQGGRIWVNSIENKGSVFSFSIPVKVTS